MQIFKHAIDKRAEVAMSLNPSVQTGFLIDTQTIVKNAIAHPFFHCLNNMAPIDSNKLLEADTIKSGKTIGLKDSSGISRSPKLFCNPKYTNNGFAGFESGKIPMPSTGQSFADVVFSGTNQEIPTIVGIQNRATDLPPSLTSVTQKDLIDSKDRIGLIASLTKTQGKANTTNSQDSSFIGPRLPSSDDITKGSATPKLLDPKGKEKPSSKDLTGVGTYSNPIRTGTTKLGNSDISRIVSSTIMSWEVF